MKISGVHQCVCGFGCQCAYHNQNGELQKDRCLLKVSSYMNIPEFYSKFYKTIHKVLYVPIFGLLCLSNTTGVRNCFGYYMPCLICAHKHTIEQINA